MLSFQVNFTRESDLISPAPPLQALAAPAAAPPTPIQFVIPIVVAAPAAAPVPAHALAPASTLMPTLAPAAPRAQQDTVTAAVLTDEEIEELIYSPTSHPNPSTKAMLRRFRKETTETKSNMARTIFDDDQKSEELTHLYFLKILASLEIVDPSKSFHLNREFRRYREWIKEDDLNLGIYIHTLIYLERYSKYVSKITAKDFFVALFLANNSYDDKPYIFIDFFRCYQTADSASHLNQFSQVLFDMCKILKFELFVSQAEVENFHLRHFSQDRDKFSPFEFFNSKTLPPSQAIILAQKLLIKFGDEKQVVLKEQISQLTKEKKLAERTLIAACVYMERFNQNPKKPAINLSELIPAAIWLACYYYDDSFPQVQEVGLTRSVKLNNGYDTVRNLGFMQKTFESYQNDFCKLVGLDANVLALAEEKLLTTIQIPKSRKPGIKWPDGLSACHRPPYDPNVFIEDAIFARMEKDLEMVQLPKPELAPEPTKSPSLTAK